MTALRRLTAPLRRIGAQIALLTLFSMLVTAGIVSIIAADLHGKSDDRVAARVGMGAFMTLVRLLGEVDPSARATTVDASRRAFPQLDVALVAAPPKAVADLRPAPFLGFINEEIGAGHRLIQLTNPEQGPSGQGIRVAVQVAPDSWLLSWLPDLPPPPPFLQIGGFALFFGITLVVVVPWAAWWVARPLDRFARAAAEFSLDAEHETLPETGPDEIRLAARSFNTMRHRIADLVADRTRMLAAVGHDLRTPITRLRLRVEFLDTGEVKAALLKDLDHMHRLVEGALAFLKGGGRTDAPTLRARVDVSALVQTVADEFAELGANVAATVPDGRLMVLGRLDGLQRALENLIENALRYGRRADVTLAAVDGTVSVEVADDGPGIAPDRQAEMLRPFVRGDEARGADPKSGADGGLGLGLSIAASIVAEHGGTLAFDRTPEGRFLVRMTLPRD